MIEVTLSLLKIHKTLAARIGMFVGLIATTTALIIASLQPELTAGSVIAIAVGTGIVVVGGVMMVVAAVVSRLSLPSSNDAWILW
jgi:hypothetical protein